MAGAAGQGGFVDSIVEAISSAGGAVGGAVADYAGASAANVGGAGGEFVDAGGEAISSAGGAIGGAAANAVTQAANSALTAIAPYALAAGLIWVAVEARRAR